MTCGSFFSRFFFSFLLFCSICDGRGRKKLTRLLLSLSQRKLSGRILRDAKLYEIGAGTSEIRRLVIGRELMREAAEQEGGR